MASIVGSGASTAGGGVIGVSAVPRKAVSRQIDGPAREECTGSRGVVKAGFMAVQARGRGRLEAMIARWRVERE